MGGIEFNVHPLFFLFGVYYAATGKTFVFLTYAFSAVAHELGHSVIAAKQGVKLDKITLMPFGAVAKGDIEGLKLIDQIKIAVAGPLVNAIIAVSFVAIWWLFPETYAFTDLAVEANLTLAVVNLIPIFPLDGGRVISACLALKYGRIKQERITRTLSLILSSLLFAAFVWSAFFSVNFSLLFFSSFVFASAFGKGKNNKYERIFKLVKSKNYKGGLPFKKIAVDGSVALKNVLKMTDYNAVNEIAVFVNGKKKGVIEEDRLESIAANGDLYSPISSFLP